MIRLALIGAGKWGRNYIGAALAAGNAEITQIVPRGMPIEDVEADAVVIATGPKEAPALCIEALQAGLPVMVEKPAAITQEDAEAITIAARGKLLLVDHQHLFAHAYEELRARVICEPVRYVKTVAHGMGPHRDYSALWDYGPHDVSMILGLGIGQIKSSDIYYEDGNYSLTITFTNNIQSSTHISNNASTKARMLAVIAGNSVIIYNDLDRDSRRLWLDGKPIDTPYEPPLTRAVRAFADAVRNQGTDDYRFGSEWVTKITSILRF